MIKLIKYYKPFIFSILIAIILLFTQAMCDLKLPDYMSDIVNIGIQSNGITEVAPDVISENGFELMKIFMSEEDKEFVENQYIKVNQEDIEYVKDYPVVENKSIYVLDKCIDSGKKEKLNSIFSISARTMINLMKEMSENSNSESYTSNNTQEMDFNKIYEMIHIFSQIPHEKIEKARKNAAQLPENMLTSVGLAFTQSFYKEVEIDVFKLQREYILKTGLKMLGVCLLSISSAIFVGFLSAKIGSGIGRNLRKTVFEKVQGFSSAEFNNFSASSLITRTTNDITQVQNFSIMMIRMMCYAPVMGIGALIMMSRKTTELVWTIAVACLLIILFIIFLFKMVFPKIKIVQKLTDKINLVAKENLSGLMVIRAFGTQKYEEERFNEINQNVMKTNKFINRSLGMMMPSMMLVMNLLNLLILWLGADSVANSSMQVGDVMAVMQYGMEVVISFLFVSMIFVMMPRASVSANRIVEVLKTENTINDPENPHNFMKNKIGYVEFKNVSFKYPDAEEKILENISFVAKPGETTAIIGATGSGKSTIVSLIPRLFDVTKGEVLVNGVNVKDVKQNDLHSQIGYVMQKGNLLSGTIEENLKYGNENATKQLVEKCAEIAQATEFIENKELKYDSQISQGAKNVSGGQRQRLSIARALVKQCPIYVFDDSFSALDFKTDSNLRKALRENSKESTLIIVAQRVSTIMNAEQIIVLEEGKIVGIGKHDELLKNCNTYYEIASSQLSEEELKNAR